MRGLGVFTLMLLSTAVAGQQALPPVDQSRAGTDPAPLPTQADFAVVRYNLDGTVEASFGSGGVAATDIGTNTFGGTEASPDDGHLKSASAPSTDFVSRLTLGW